MQPHLLALIASGAGTRVYLAALTATCVPAGASTRFPGRHIAETAPLVIFRGMKDRMAVLSVLWESTKRLRALLLV